MTDELIQAPKEAPRADARSAPRRSAQEERFLTEFARNYLTGRRWMCGIAHAVAAVGAFAAGLAAIWQYGSGALEAVRHVMPHSH